MKSVSLVLASACIVFSGCATVIYGQKDVEGQLRDLKPVADKVSLYVCREKAAFIGAGNRSQVMVDEKDIGALKPNSFAHAILEPGTHDIYIDHHPGGKSGTYTLKAIAGDVPILRVGFTGHGWGVLTIDEFNSRGQAEGCIRSASYAVPNK